MAIGNAGSRHTFFATRVLATGAVVGLLLGSGTARVSAGADFPLACRAAPEESTDGYAPMQWDAGMLSFSCARLEDVVTEYNRHSSVKVAVYGNTLADLLIGGAFKTENAESFTNGLRNVLRLRADRRGNTIRISRTDEPLSLTSRTLATFPANRARTKLGVGEVVTITASTEVSWKLSGEGSLSTSRGRRTTFTADERASQATLIAEANGQSTSITFTVVEPESETVIRKQELRYSGRCLGAGMLLTIQVNPIDVSFENVETLELPGEASDVTGYFTLYHPAGLVHQPNQTWTPLMEGNTIRDTATLVGPDPPWSDGSFEWRIQGRWRVKGSHHEGRLRMTSQLFVLEAATHTVRITKLDETVERAAPRAKETLERQRNCRAEQTGPVRFSGP
jgi:hypothetical protein